MAEVAVLSLTPDLKIPANRMPAGYADATEIADMIAAALGGSPVNEAAVTSLINAAIASKTIAFNLGITGPYSGRHVGGNPEFFLGVNQPLANGSITGGGGMVPQLDVWFELKAA